MENNSIWVGSAPHNPHQIDIAKFIDLLGTYSIMSQTEREKELGIIKMSKPVYDETIEVVVKRDISEIELLDVMLKVGSENRGKKLAGYDVMHNTTGQYCAFIHFIDACKK